MDHITPHHTTLKIKTLIQHNECLAAFYSAQKWISITWKITCTKWKRTKEIGKKWIRIEKKTPCSPWSNWVTYFVDFFLLFLFHVHLLLSIGVEKKMIKLEYESHIWHTLNIFIWSKSTNGKYSSCQSLDGRSHRKNEKKEEKHQRQRSFICTQCYLNILMFI